MQLAATRTNRIEPTCPLPPTATAYPGVGPKCHNRNVIAVVCRDPNHAKVAMTVKLSASTGRRQRFGRRNVRSDVAALAIASCPLLASAADALPPIALWTITAASVVLAIASVVFLLCLRHAMQQIQSRNTQQANAFAELQASQALLNAVFQTVPVVVSVKDESGRILMINAECERFHKQPASEFVDKTDFDLYSVERAHHIREQDLAALNSDSMRTITELFPNIDGSSSWVEKRKMAVSLSDGRRILVTTVHDLSEVERTRAEALEAQQFLNSIINAIPHGLFVKDEQHRWLLANRAFGTFVGADADALIGRTDSDFFPLSEAEIAWSQDDVVLSSGETLVVEQSMRTPDGRTAWYQKTKSILRTSTGRRLVVGLAKNVTAIRQAELALRESEARWSSVVSSAKEGIVVLDDHGIIEIANDAMHGMFGYAAPELIGQSVKTLVPTSHHDHLDAYLSRSKDGDTRNEVGHVRYVEGRRRDGVLVPIEMSVSEAIVGSSRRLTGVLRDQSVQTRLRDIAVQTELVAHIGGWEYDLITRNLFWTEGTYRIHEVDPSSFVPSVESALAFYTAEYRPRIAEIVQRSIDTGAPYDDVLQIETGRGRLRWVRTSGKTVIRDGRPVKLYGAIQDVTEQRRVDNELRHHRDHLQELVGSRTQELQLAKEAAESAMRAKSVFLTNMSHELRTPLHAILSFSDLAIQRAKAGHSDRAVAFLEKIGLSATRLSTLLTDVFDVVELESHSVVLRRTDQNVSSLLADVVESFRDTANAHDVTIEVVGDSLEYRAAMDRDRVQQVLRKLLSNAIAYSPRGGVVVLCVYRPTDAPDMLCVEIMNQGPGIPETELENIFEKGVQSANTATGAGGRGLGLTICRLIARAHHGDVIANNNTGGGACFSLLLPIRSEENKEVTRTLAASSEGLL